MTELTNYQMLIDGQWVDAEDGKAFDSVNPTTGQPWARIPEASAADVDRAVRAAHRAFSEGPWSKMTPTERGKLLRKLGDLLGEKSEDLGRAETVDTGKLFKETRWQAKYIADFFHYNAGLADKIHGDTMPIDKPDMYVFTTREPLGVVAAVVPWNSQLFLVAVKLGPALAAGNTVVLKASEHASAPMLEFGKLIAEAGIPDGVVNIVTGFGEPCGRVLTTHPLVARISFTGGPETARHIVRNSAENFAQVSLELGGKSPVMVFEDADLESAANGIVAGIFGASGQSCSICTTASPTRCSIAWSARLARSASAIRWPTRRRWARWRPRRNSPASRPRSPRPRKRAPSCSMAARGRPATTPAGSSSRPSSIAPTSAPRSSIPSCSARC